MTEIINTDEQIDAILDNAEAVVAEEAPAPLPEDAPAPITEIPTDNPVATAGESTGWTLTEEAFNALTNQVNALVRRVSTPTVTQEEELEPETTTVKSIDDLDLSK